MKTLNVDVYGGNAMHAHYKTREMKELSTMLIATPVAILVDIENDVPVLHYIDDQWYDNQLMEWIRRNPTHPRGDAELYQAVKVDQQRWHMLGHIVGALSATGSKSITAYVYVTDVCEASKLRALVPDFKIVATRQIIQ